MSLRLLTGFVFLVVAMAVALASCSGSHKFYPGPELPKKQLARIECYKYRDELDLMKVDGQKAPRSYVMVLPGRHELTIRGPKNITAKADPEVLSDLNLTRPMVTVELDVLAGRIYYLGISLKDLVSTRAVQDEMHSWQEGFYRAWSLDVFEKAMDSRELPELTRSFDFQAE